MRENRATISGPPDVVAREFRKLADELERGETPTLYVEPNGDTGLVLDFDISESYRDEGGNRMLVEFS
jgi:hypothetical protein